MTKPKRPPMVLLAVAGVLIAVIGFGLWRWSRFNDVYVVNGLPVAIDVSIDGKTMEVVANFGRVTFPKLPVGTHVVEVKHKGMELETMLIFVKGGSHHLIYNVGGTAPLVWERIAYTTHSSTQQPQWNMYCGRRFIELDSIDYVFTEPPKSISTKGGGTIYKTHLTLDDGGLKACQSWALDKGTPEMWVDWQRLEAKLDPKKAIYAVDELARQGDLREAQLMLEQALEKEPSLDLRRTHELVLVASNQWEKARALYARDVGDEKATDLDLYLSARLLGGAEHFAYLDEALKRFPESSYLHWLRAHSLDRKGDSTAALAELGLAEAGAPEALQWSISNSQVIALLHLGRKNEAWGLGRNIYGDSTNVEGAVAYANLARVTGNSNSGWDAKLKPYQARWAQALLSLPISDPVKGGKDYDPPSFRKAREVIQLTLDRAPSTSKTLKAGVDPSPPAAALALAVKYTDVELRLVPESIVWLLLTEAWRLGDTAAATKLSRHASGYDAAPHAEAQRFIATGQLTPSLDQISDAQLAVLWLARGRRLATLGEDPKAAIAQARRLDAFGSVVARALEQWPAAQPGARLAWVPVTASTPP